LDKQLVLTSDKPPVQLDGMEDRLVTRLKWGLTAELLPPDLPLRKRIIAKKIEETNIAVPDSIADYIADKVSANIRDIEGVMISLAAEAKLNKRPIDLPLVRRIVARTVSVRIEAPTIPRIRETVCRYYNIDHAVLQTPSRKHEIVQARQVAMYLAKKYTNSSLSAIGNEIGRRDHASVVYAVKAVQNQMEVDKQLRAAIETIENLIKVS
jgi:chromosomal replication initiator protein